jgi:hypothetical protein
MISFELSNDEASALNESDDSAVMFLWDAEAGQYKSRIDKRPSRGRSHSVSGAGSGKFEWE